METYDMSNNTKSPKPKKLNKASKTTAHKPDKPEIDIQDIKNKAKNKTNRLETVLNGIFADNAPFNLSNSTKQWIATYLPWISFISGVMGIIVLINLWQISQGSNFLNNYVTQLAEQSGKTIQLPKTNIFWWLAFIGLAIQSGLILTAFSKLKAYSKKGWDLLFYSSLISAVTTVVSLLGNMRSVSGTILGAVSLIVSWYLLFQIRELYTYDSVKNPKINNN